MLRKYLGPSGSSKVLRAYIIPAVSRPIRRICRCPLVTTRAVATEPTALQGVLEQLQADAIDTEQQEQQHEEEQQQQQEQLLRAVEDLWPTDSLDDKVKRTVARDLLQQTQYTTFLSYASHTAFDEHGSLARLSQRFKRLLENDPSGCLTVIDNEDNTMPLLQLDEAALLGAAQRKQQPSQQQQQEQEQQGPSSGKAAAELHVKQVVAEYLLQQLGHTAKLSAAASTVGKQLGGMADLGIQVGFKELLQQDPSGCFQVSGTDCNSEVITLDVPKFFQQQQRQQQQSRTEPYKEEAGAFPTQGSRPAESAHMEQQAEAAGDLQQAITALWGPNSRSGEAAAAALRVKQVVAEYLLQQPGHTAKLSAAGSRVGKQLGGMADLGIQVGFKELLQQDPSGCFKVSGTGRNSEVITLDVSALLKHSQKQQQQQQQQQGRTQRIEEQAETSRPSLRRGQPLTAAGLAQGGSSTAPNSTVFIKSSAAAGTRAVQVEANISQFQFELQLLRDSSGWVKASYMLHEHQQQEQERGRKLLFGQHAKEAGIEAPSGSAAGDRLLQLVLAGSQEDTATFKLVPLSTSSSSSNDVSSSSNSTDAEPSSSDSSSSSSSEDEACSAAADLPLEAEGGHAPTGSTGSSSSSSSTFDFSLDEDTDEAVWSIARLLPERARADLQPFMPLGAAPSLEEVIIDKNKPVTLRLSDRSSRVLPYVIDVVEALSLLEAARAQWQMQGLVMSDDEDSSPFPQPELQPYFLPDVAYTGQSASTLRHARDFGGLFRADGRMGVPGTLHRISVLRNLEGAPVGLTYRLGRHIPDKALLLADLLSSMKASIMPGSPVDRAQSLLVLGKPGTGKTTLLRDIARFMSLPPAQGGLGLAVLIVDTSNEIAGDADECHPCIGFARRIMVPRREEQAQLLVQAVQNHNPDVIIVDEIGTKQEVEAARTIAERGVVLVGTAHGNSLSNLMRNPVLRPLVGGLQAVTLGDETAQATNSGVKTRLERSGAATFVSLLELNSRDMWRLHADVEQSVDSLLRSPTALLAELAPYSASSIPTAAQASIQGTPGVPNTQVRSRDASGRLWVQFETAGAAQQMLQAARLVEQLAEALPSSS